MDFQRSLQNSCSPKGKQSTYLSRYEEASRRKKRYLRKRAKLQKTPRFSAKKFRLMNTNLTSSKSKSKSKQTSQTSSSKK